MVQRRRPYSHQPEGIELSGDQELKRQVELAVRSASARYILTAVIDGADHDAGETVIGPVSDVVGTVALIRSIVSDKLRKASLAADQICRAVILIEDVPALY